MNGIAKLFFIAAAGAGFVLFLNDLGNTGQESRPYTAIDGDTFRTGNGQIIRLARINAPERGGRPANGLMAPNPFDLHNDPRYAEISRNTLQKVLNHRLPLICRNIGISYGRRVSECSQGSVNISDLLMHLPKSYVVRCKLKNGQPCEVLNR